MCCRSLSCNNRLAAGDRYGLSGCRIHFFLNPPILVVCLAAFSEKIVYLNENPLLNESLQSLIFYLGSVPVTTDKSGLPVLTG